jgi:hypothetical protein
MLRIKKMCIFIVRHRAIVAYCFPSTQTRERPKGGGKYITTTGAMYLSEKQFGNGILFVFSVSYCSRTIQRHYHIHKT